MLLVLSEETFIASLLLSGLEQRIDKGKLFHDFTNKNFKHLIFKTLRTGILSLIPIDAAYAAGAVGWLGGLPVLVLLPISLWLTSRYRVT